MSDTKSFADRLDEQIEALLAGTDSDVQSDPDATSLLAVVSELRCVPDPGFRIRLKDALLDAILIEQGNGTPATRVAADTGAVQGNVRSKGDMPNKVLPSLFGEGYNPYAVRRSSFVTSLAAHVIAGVLIVTAGIWAAPRVQDEPHVRFQLVTDISYVLPPAATEVHGGGGGGDHDILQASKGTPPRFSPDQVTPPAIVVRNEQPKLPAEPTVVGPPNLSFPQTSQLGDPLSAILERPSNGPGSRGGIGSGDSGGVGPGRGPGVGQGWGGGIGGGPYRIGGGVTAPRAIYDPEPEYSDEARKQKYQGTAILQVVIDRDGIPRDVRIARSAGMGLDEKAIEAVRRWRFEPGRLEGQPVAVVVNVEVYFRLY